MTWESPGGSRQLAFCADLSVEVSIATIASTRSTVCHCGNVAGSAQFLRGPAWKRAHVAEKASVIRGGSGLEEKGFRAVGAPAIARGKSPPRRGGLMFTVVAGT